MTHCSAAVSAPRSCWMLFNPRLTSDVSRIAMNVARHITAKISPVPLDKPFSPRIQTRERRGSARVPGLMDDEVFTGGQLGVSRCIPLEHRAERRLRICPLHVEVTTGFSFVIT